MLKLLRIPGPGGRAVWVYTLLIAGGPMLVSAPFHRRDDCERSMGDEVLCLMWDLENVQGYPVPVADA